VGPFHISRGGGDVALSAWQTIPREPARRRRRSNRPAPAIPPRAATAGVWLAGRRRCCRCGARRAGPSATGSCRAPIMTLS